MVTPMRWLAAAGVLLLLLLGSDAAAQTTSGTISGHVVDSQGLAVAGATITAASPNLQGTRTVKSSSNGDYVITLLPPGTYSVSAELNGFETQQQTLALAPTQTVALNFTMAPGRIAETIDVVAPTADIMTQTAQVATNFTQALINLLPTPRSIDSVLLLASAVHPSGPGGAFSVAGAMSFESLFLVNGVTVNENVRGQPLPLIIEDAI